MSILLQKISACQTCAAHLPHGINPVLTAHEKSPIVIIGQAPGRKVHESSIPWDDKSGDNLRAWLDVSKEDFYNPQKLALIPMGFCYPGTGKSGDLPPRKECAPQWHPGLMDQMKEVQLVILIGQYAQQYYLKKKRLSNLTETVKNFKSYLPEFFVLPHPSPRNNIWRAKNQWFDQEVIPELQKTVKYLLP
ncbi:uracil-DNA glycosylase family protein [bacterium SCSIO 12741]|nr:uracil-DNA glycosylase family protein [bacterium SCSIO 12741]